MVAVAELMFRSRNALALLPRYTGQTVGIAQVAVIFGFAALIYFVINFTLSLRGFVTCISADTPPRGTWEKPPDPQKKFSATFPS